MNLIFYAKSTRSMGFDPRQAATFIISAIFLGGAVYSVNLVTANATGIFNNLVGNAWLSKALIIAGLVTALLGMIVIMRGNRDGYVHALVGFGGLLAIYAPMIVDMLSSQPTPEATDAGVPPLVVLAIIYLLLALIIATACRAAFLLLKSFKSLE